MAVALLLAAPSLADDAPAPSLTAIAAALRDGHAGDAEAMATQMLAANDPVPLTNAYLLLDRGLAREQLGKRSEAEKDFTRAIDSKTLPSNELARALFDRGVILDELGRTEEAIADYTQAVTMVPRYATALNNRGNAYRRTGRYALARKDYEAALNAGDDEPEYPLYGLGRVAEAQGDPAMAKQFYQKALAANAEFTPARQHMAALEPLPANGGYELHPPIVTAARTESRHAEPAAAPQQGASKVENTESIGLRPAIPYGTRARKPIRLASIAPPEIADATPNTGDVVQLGAWRDRGDAASGWTHIAAKAGDLLSGAAPQIIQADIPGKGRYWRLRTQAPSGTTAAAFCARLQAQGLSCIAVKS